MEQRLAQTPYSANETGAAVFQTDCHQIFQKISFSPICSWEIMRLYLRLCQDKE